MIISLPKSAAGLLLLATCFFCFLVGCKKDRFNELEKPVLTQTTHSPISIDEAKNYFETIDLTHLSSAVGDSLPKPFYIKIEPMWDRAFLSNAASGRSIVIVPLADTSLMTQNNGRVNAQLIFSSSGPDSIFAQILLSAATPAYHAANANRYDLNNFSGAFVFFDLNLNFQFGVVLEAGSAVSLVDSVGVSNSNVIEDRTQTCIEYLDFTEVCEGWEWAIVVCTTEVTIFTQCSDDNGNGSGGGGGGGGGGSGPLPPVVLSQYSWLAPYIQDGQFNVYTILSMGVPLQVFLYYGGELPPGFNLEHYIHLQQLQNICDFNASQYHWLETHYGLVGLISGFLNQHNNAAEWIQAVKEVIDARIGSTEAFSWASMEKLIKIQEAMGLTQAQLKWLIDHSLTQMADKAVDVVYGFLQSKDFAPEAVSISKLMLDLEMHGEIPVNYQSGSFQQILSDHPELLARNGLIQTL